MKKKSICLIVVVVLLLIMLIPIKDQLYDGGSVEYKAILYSVIKYHVMNPESTKGYDDGWKIKIVGLTVYDEINTYTEAGKTDNETAYKEVTLEIKENTLTKDGVTLILKNNTTDEYTYGLDFYLEKYENEKWINASTITGDPLSWNTIAYKLKSSESIEINLDFKSTYGSLSAGKYRVIKRASKEEDKPITEDKIIKLYAEFEIK